MKALTGFFLWFEPSFESLTVAEKIKGLASGMNKPVSAVLNKIDSERIAHKLEGELKTRDIEVIGTIPNDPLVFEACLEGQAIGGGKAFHAAGRYWAICCRKIERWIRRRTCV